MVEKFNIKIQIKLKNDLYRKNEFTNNNDRFLTRRKKMNLHEYDPESKVYYSAPDRFVKKINDYVFETYHIDVIAENSVLNVSTIDLSQLTEKQINHYLKNCGLKYMEAKKKLVQLHDENQIVEDDIDKFNYVLVDRLGISGAGENPNHFSFVDAYDLNELILEHNIPHHFDKTRVQSL